MDLMDHNWGLLYIEDYYIAENVLYCNKKS